LVSLAVLSNTNGIALKYLHWLTLVLIFIPTIALAIVIRPGVSDSKYLISGNAFPALVDLPGEGQGALIAGRWVVTTAHATQGYKLSQVWLHGKWREVATGCTFVLVSQFRKRIRWR
jgi:hypothetical protein